MQQYCHRGFNSAADRACKPFLIQLPSGYRPRQVSPAAVLVPRPAEEFSSSAECVESLLYRGLLFSRSYVHSRQCCHATRLASTPSSTARSVDEDCSARGVTEDPSPSGRELRGSSRSRAPVDHAPQHFSTGRPAGDRRLTPFPQRSTSPEFLQPHQTRQQQQGQRQGQGPSDWPERWQGPVNHSPERRRGQVLSDPDPERKFTSPRRAWQDQGQGQGPVGLGTPLGQSQPRVDGHELSTGLALTWLGTNSGTPTLERNVSCTLVRLPGTVQMVDTGEGTPRQLMSMIGLDPAEVDGIFVTHLHGDHCFGLGATLALLDEAKAERMQDPARRRHHVYGPPGLAELARHTLATTGLDRRLRLPLTITEFVTTTAAAHPPRPLAGPPSGDLLQQWAQLLAGRSGSGAAAGSEAASGRRDGRTGAEILLQRLAPKKVSEAQDLQAAVRVVTPQLAQLNEIWQRPSRWYAYPYDDGSGSCSDGGDSDADAGSSADEDGSGASSSNCQSPTTVRKFFFATEGLYWDIPGTAGVRVRAAQLQHRVPCWGYVFQELQPFREGYRRRKVVVLGDTVSSRPIAPLAAGCDVLSHEATFAAGMEAKARVAQHSTGWMAGEFAAAVGARNLVLTHFSARYRDVPMDFDRQRTSRSTNQLEADQQAWAVARLLDEAAETFGRRNNVFAASDFYTFGVPLRQAASSTVAAAVAAAVGAGAVGAASAADVDQVEDGGDEGDLGERLAANAELAVAGAGVGPGRGAKEGGARRGLLLRRSAAA